MPKLSDQEALQQEILKNQFTSLVQIAKALEKIFGMPIEQQKRLEYLESLRAVHVAFLRADNEAAFDAVSEWLKAFEAKLPKSVYLTANSEDTRELKVLINNLSSICQMMALEQSQQRFPLDVQRRIMGIIFDTLELFRRVYYQVDPEVKESMLQLALRMNGTFPHVLSPSQSSSVSQPVISLMADINKLNNIIMPIINKTETAEALVALKRRPSNKA